MAKKNSKVVFIDNLKKLAKIDHLTIIDSAGHLDELRAMKTEMSNEGKLLGLTEQNIEQLYDQIHASNIAGRKPQKGELLIVDHNNKEVLLLDFLNLIEMKIHEVDIDLTEGKGQTHAPLFEALEPSKKQGL